MRAYLAIWLTLPMFLFGFNITSSVRVVGVFSAANAVAVLRSINLRTGRVPTWGSVLANLVLVVLFSQWVGALLLTPLFHLSADRRVRVARETGAPTGGRAGVGARSVVLAILLEQLGVLSPR